MYDPYDMTDEDFEEQGLTEVAKRGTEIVVADAVDDSKKFDIVQISKFARSKNTILLCSRFPEFMDVLIEMLGSDSPISKEKADLLKYIIDKTTAVSTPVQESGLSEDMSEFTYEQIIQEVITEGSPEKTKKKQTIKRRAKSKK